MLTLHTTSRVLASAVIGALLFASSAARASDGGSTDAAEDAAHAMTAADAAIAGTDAAHGCSAIGEPCAKGVACCDTEAYCGSFGGVGTSLVCGNDATNALPTSSCGVGGGSAPGGSGFDAFTLVGALAIGVGVRRRRRAR